MVQSADYQHARPPHRRGAPDFPAAQSDGAGERHERPLRPTARYLERRVRPIGDDGYFKPFFDKRSGEIDPEVAQYWKKNYDLRYYLQKNWREIGPKLVGKLHVICGHEDNFFLNFGVYYMEEFPESTTDPYYAGSFTYGGRGGHGWRPYSTAHLLRLMAGHITKNAPAGADTKQWKY
jgi:hypothetical protein